MRILAIDVHYRASNAKVVGVLFDSNNESDYSVHTCFVEDVMDYQSGSFYKRELPCILALLKSINSDKYDVLLVDSYIYTSNTKNLGLGAHLYKTLEEKTPVIGVAKSQFKSNANVCREVYRGDSKNPLYISSIGMELETASQLVTNLEGPYRFPNILAILDGITKNDDSG